MAENRNQHPNQGARQRGRQDEDLGNRMDRDRTVNREENGNRSGGDDRENRGMGGTGQGGGMLRDDEFGSDR